LALSMDTRPPPHSLFPYTTLFRSLQAPFRAPGLDLAPERARMVGVDQVAELVHQHVLERVRARDHQREVQRHGAAGRQRSPLRRDRKSTRLNSSHVKISYAVFCLK